MELSPHHITLAYNNITIPACIFIIYCVFVLKDWDKPQHIADPDAKKPDDWDDEIDGEWEPPMIDNPDYKVGEKSDKQGF